MVTFSREKVTPAVSRIRNSPDVCMYLVEGRDRAVLIDTGNGVGDLKGYVEKMLDGKPYDVIVTHGHVDHASGADQFERVFMNELDYELSLKHCAIEHRKESFSNWRRMFPKIVMPQFEEEDFIPVRTRPYLPLEDGQEFKLGGITLRMIHTPGHTQGIMVILDIEERIAFFGDACGVEVLMLAEEAGTIEEYRDSLKRLKTFSGLYDRVLRNHGACESPCTVLDDNIAVCEKILEGTDDKVPEIFEGMPCIRAMAIDCKSRKRIDGGEGNILYLANKIVSH